MRLPALMVISIVLLNTLWIVGCSSSEKVRLSLLVIEASADRNATR